MAAAPVEMDFPNGGLHTIVNLIGKDIVALTRWNDIGDQFILDNATKLNISRLCGTCNYKEAITLTLVTWSEEQGTHATLQSCVDKLREHQLNRLADSITKNAEKIRTAAANKVGSHDPDRLGIGGVRFGIGELPPYFVDRASELESLHQSVTNIDTSSESSFALVTRVVGLGGIGKTTLVRRYLYKSCEIFNGNIIWTQAESTDSMRETFLALVEELKKSVPSLEVPPDIPNERLASKIYECFRNSKCLFVFDGVEEFKHFDQFRPKGLNPSLNIQPYVIITSQSQLTFPDSEGKMLKLEVFNNDDAVKLIKKRLVNATDGDAIKLAKALGRFPLALQQALAYLYLDAQVNPLHGAVIGNFIEKYEVQRLKLFQDTRFMEFDPYKKTLYATWRVTFDKIEKIEDNYTPVGKLAIELLEYMAYLNQHCIQCEFLHRMYLELNNPEFTSKRNGAFTPFDKCARTFLDRTVKVTVSEVNQAFGILLVYSLIEHANKDHSQFRMHKLVQDVVRVDCAIGEREATRIRKVVHFLEKSISVHSLQKQAVLHGLHIRKIQIPNLEKLVTFFGKIEKYNGTVQTIRESLPGAKEADVVELMHVLANNEHIKVALDFMKASRLTLVEYLEMWHRLNGSRTWTTDIQEVTRDKLRVWLKALESSLESSGGTSSVAIEIAKYFPYLHDAIDERFFTTLVETATGMTEEVVRSGLSDLQNRSIIEIGSVLVDQIASYTIGWLRTPEERQEDVVAAFLLKQADGPNATMKFECFLHGLSFLPKYLDSFELKSKFPELPLVLFKILGTAEFHKAWTSQANPKTNLDMSIRDFKSLMSNAWEKFVLPKLNCQVITNEIRQEIISLFDSDSDSSLAGVAGCKRNPDADMAWQVHPEVQEIGSNLVPRDHVRPQFRKNLLNVNIDRFSSDQPHANNLVELENNFVTLVELTEDRKVSMNPTDFIAMLDTVPEMPLVIFCIKGRGKSFMLNNFIKYLEFGNETNDWVIKGHSSNLELCSDLDSTRNGIRVWPKVYKKDVRGREVGVVLMEVVEHLDDRANEAVFLLSTLLSSTEIFYTNEHAIDVTHFPEQLYEFAKWYSTSRQSEKKAFQKLIFLIRDWDDARKYGYGSHTDSACPPNLANEHMNLKRYLLDEKMRGKSERAWQTANYCYEDICVVALPPSADDLATMDKTDATNSLPDFKNTGWPPNLNNQHYGLAEPFGDGNFGKTTQQAQATLDTTNDDDHCLPTTSLPQHPTIVIATILAGRGSDVISWDADFKKHVVEFVESLFCEDYLHLNIKRITEVEVTPKALKSIISCWSNLYSNSNNLPSMKEVFQVTAGLQGRMNLGVNHHYPIRFPQITPVKKLENDQLESKFAQSIDLFRRNMESTTLKDQMATMDKIRCKHVMKRQLQTIEQGWKSTIKNSGKLGDPDRKRKAKRLLTGDRTPHFKVLQEKQDDMAVAEAERESDEEVDY